jgi:hypothetical protein
MKKEKKTKFPSGTCRDCHPAGPQLVGQLAENYSPPTRTCSSPVFTNQVKLIATTFMCQIKLLKNKLPLSVITDIML